MSHAFPPPPEPDELSANPYAAPLVDVGFEPIGLGEGDLATAEAIRQAHIRHEASIKGLGALAIFGAVFLIIAGIFLILLGIGALPTNVIKGFTEENFVAGLGAFELALGILGVFVGLGLRKFRPWARWTEVVFCALTLLSSAIQFNPIGVLFAVYFLYLLLSRKATMIFSREYQTIIERTPHIQYKARWLLKIFFAVVIAIILVFAVVLVLGIMKPT